MSSVRATGCPKGSRWRGYLNWNEKWHLMFCHSGQTWQMPFWISLWKPFAISNSVSWFWPEAFSEKVVYDLGPELSTNHFEIQNSDLSANSKVFSLMLNTLPFKLLPNLHTLEKLLTLISKFFNKCVGKNLTQDKTLWRQDLFLFLFKLNHCLEHFNLNNPSSLASTKNYL